jgi:probable HAF family extracellular repeat protein
VVKLSWVGIVVAALAASGRASAQTGCDFVVLPASGDIAGVFAEGISRDGTVVVGYVSTPAGQRAFRWTALDGFLVLGTFPSGGASQAFAVSDDGSVIVGRAVRAGNYRPFRWTLTDGFVELTGFDGAGPAGASDVSADGSVIVGTGPFGGILQGFRWTAASGVVNLGSFPGQRGSGAQAVSADGQITVGSGTAPGGQRPFRVAGNQFITELPNIPEGTASAADISPLGTIIGTYSGTNNGFPVPRAFRWLDGVLTDLGVRGTNNAHESRAYVITGDGRYVGGDSGAPGRPVPVIWESGQPVRNIAEFFAAKACVPVPGIEFTINLLTGTSADGLSMIGYASRTTPNQPSRSESWILHLGPRCRADYNGDGFVDFFDFAEFSGCFDGSGCPIGKNADFNRDGFADFFDVDEFALAFEAGCP